jgi:hemolysin activation/secretion protein
MVQGHWNWQCLWIGGVTLFLAIKGLSASRRRVAVSLVIGVASIVIAGPAAAQTTAPSSVTPPTLRPEAPATSPVMIPQSDGLRPPAGTEGLSVTLAGVDVEGGYPEVAGQTDAILAKLKGRKVTLAEVYATASAIEAAHVRAGYILVRASVPPQQLVDGGTVRIVIVDGFIEDVDTSTVPARSRAVVAARVAGLAGRHHIKLAQIEEPLLLASDVPGVSLSSTLMRGSQPGGARLVINAKQHLLSGNVGFDNSYSPLLDRYGFSTQLSLNSALGLGEQFYGFAAGGYDLGKFFSTDAPVRVLGGGAVVPFVNGRLVVNPEATFSRTQPFAPAGVTRTRGVLQRLTVRAGYTITKTRAHTVAVNATVEQLDETNSAIDFGAEISHDRFMAARLGLSYTRTQFDGSYLALSGQVSQGLGSLGALTVLPAGVLVSRQRAARDFTKLGLTLRGGMPVAPAVQLAVTVREQTTFGQAVFRSEQTTLEGPDALSAYTGGGTAADSAVTGRAELIRTFATAAAKERVQIAPYAFVAAGTGWIERPTVLEPGRITAGAAGIGARIAVEPLGLSLAAEYAHGFADVAALDEANRVNVSVALRF